MLACFNSLPKHGSVHEGEWGKTAIPTFEKMPKNQSEPQPSCSPMASKTPGRIAFEYCSSGVQSSREPLLDAALALLEE
jgi:hypothetical protein